MIGYEFFKIIVLFFKTFIEQTSNVQQNKIVFTSMIVWLEWTIHCAFQYS